MRSFLIAAIVALAVPTLAFANLPCPCEPEPIAALPLSTGALVDVALRAMIQNGIAVLFVGALAVVGAPWVMAGLAVALFQLPERWKAQR